VLRAKGKGMHKRTLLAMLPTLALLRSYFWRPAPLCTRGLRVYARTHAHGSHVEVQVAPDASVAALAEACARKLELGAPLQSVRLLREKRGGALAPLVSARALARQRVREGTLLLVQVEEGAAPPPLLRLPQLSALTALGVLVHGPDAAMDGGQLAALAHPATPCPQRLRALGQLAAAHLRRHPSSAASAPLALPIFHTAAHAALLQHLAVHARQLAAGGFVGTTGAACGVLVGARGSGKTTVLRAFAAVAASAFPGLIALYVSGEGVDDVGSPLRAAGLRDLIAAAARSRGVNVQHAGGLEAGLQQAGLRVLVIVDEVDDLYRVSLDEAHAAVRGNVVATLGKLAHMAGHAAGLYGVLLCGSSSSTYHLLCGPTLHLQDKFPLVTRGVPDMNSTKMPRIRLPLASCSASGEVAGMLAALAQLSAPPGGAAMDLLPQARLLTFFLGASPRAVCAAALRGSPALGSAQLAAAGPASPLPTDFALRHTLPLYQALLARLGTSNAALQALTRCADGTANVVALMDPACAWEDAIAPLAWWEVREVWEACAREAGLPLPAQRDELMLQRLVDDLVDAHLLHQRQSSQGGALELWPVSAAQVAGAGGGGVPGAWLQQAEAALRPLAGLLQGAGATAQTVLALASVASKVF
jgi:hypothetical protein